MPNSHLLSLRQQPMITMSPRMQRVMDRCDRVARTDAPVLICGESGAGKERIAQYIHDESSRRRSPFISVNCSAMPDTLLASELFGHEKGAFTGASAQHRGLFEQADGGTLMLDELGGVTRRFQLSMLRVLQTGQFTRVGGKTPLTSNVRIIGATNADLPQKVRERKFRSDLYYRLNVFPIALPPLRARPEDLEGIVAQRLTALNCSIAPAALERLKRHRWPGNVRELENVLERAFILSGALDTDRGTGSSLSIETDHIQIDESFDVLREGRSGSDSFATIDKDRGGSGYNVTVQLRLGNVGFGEIYDACEDALGTVLSEEAISRAAGVAKGAALLGRNRSTLHNRRRQPEQTPEPIGAGAAQ